MKNKGIEMNVLLTGGAGYIGSFIAKKLLEKGHRVLILDDLSRGHLRAIPDGADLFVCDIHDSWKWEYLLSHFGIDSAILLAGRTEVGLSSQQAKAFYRTNVVGMFKTLELLVANHVRKVVFSSSCAVYGEWQGRPFLETSQASPINPYGATKLCGEWMLRDMSEAYGFQATALRYFNVAGASEDGEMGEDHDPETHLIPIAIKSVMVDAPCPIFGNAYGTIDGTCVRDYIHVEDLAEAHLLALEREADTGFEAFNVGTNTGHSVYGVLDAIEKVMGKRVPTRLADPRRGDPAQLICDASKIRKMLKFVPRQSDLPSIIRSAVNWHTNKPNGYGGE